MTPRGTDDCDSDLLGALAAPTASTPVSTPQFAALHDRVAVDIDAQIVADAERVARGVGGDWKLYSRWYEAWDVMEPQRVADKRSDPAARVQAAIWTAAAIWPLDEQLARQLLERVKWNGQGLIDDHWQRPVEEWWVDGLAAQRTLPTFRMREGLDLLLDARQGGSLALDQRRDRAYQRTTLIAEAAVEQLAEALEVDDHVLTDDLVYGWLRFRQTPLGGALGASRRQALSRLAAAWRASPEETARLQLTPGELLDAAADPEPQLARLRSVRQPGWQETSIDSHSQRFGTIRNADHFRRAASAIIARGRAQRPTTGSWSDSGRALRLYVGKRVLGQLLAEQQAAQPRLLLDVLDSHDRADKPTARKRFADLVVEFQFELGGHAVRVQAARQLVGTDWIGGREQLLVRVQRELAAAGLSGEQMWDVEVRHDQRRVSGRRRWSYEQASTPPAGERWQSVESLDEVLGTAAPCRHRRARWTPHDAYTARRECPDCLEACLEWRPRLAFRLREHPGHGVAFVTEPGDDLGPADNEQCLRYERMLAALDGQPAPTDYAALLASWRIPATTATGSAAPHRQPALLRPATQILGLDD